MANLHGNQSDPGTPGSSGFSTIMNTGKVKPLKFDTVLSLKLAVEKMGSAGVNQLDALVLLTLLGYAYRADPENTTGDPVTDEQIGQVLDGFYGPTESVDTDNDELDVAALSGPCAVSMMRTDTETGQWADEYNVECDTAAEAVGVAEGYMHRTVPTLTPGQHCKAEIDGRDEDEGTAWRRQHYCVHGDPDMHVHDTKLH
jgi:hypothetical protein